MFRGGGEEGVLGWGAQSRVQVRWSGLGEALSNAVRHLGDSQIGLPPDVTLAVSGKQIRAHRLVLAACSPFFASIFRENPFENPIIVLQDINFTALSTIISYIYNGEVNVMESFLPTLMKTAKYLQVKGLSTPEDVYGDVEDEAVDTSIVKKEIIDENYLSNLDIKLDEIIPKTEPTDFIETIMKDDNESNDMDDNNSRIICRSPDMKRKLTHRDIKRVSKIKRNKIKDKSAKQKCKNLPKTDKENEIYTENRDGEAIDQFGGGILSNLEKDIVTVLHSKNLTDNMTAGSEKEDICPVNPNTKNELNENEMRSNFPCPFCNRTYFSWGYRRRHVKARHESKSLTCKWCFVALDSETLWFEHVVNNHGLSCSQARDSLIIMVEAHTVLACSSPPSPASMLHHLQLNTVSTDNVENGVCNE